MRHDTRQDAGSEWAVTGGDSSIPGVMAGDWPSRLVEWNEVACQAAAVGVALFMLQPLGSAGYLPPPSPKYGAEREPPQTEHERPHEVADELPACPLSQFALNLLSGFSSPFCRLVQLTSCLGWLVLHAHAPRRFAACGHCAQPGLRAASCAAQRCAVPHSRACHSSVTPTGLSFRQGLRRTQSVGSAAWRLYGCRIGMR